MALLIGQGERDSDEQASVLAAGATLAREPP